MSRAVLLIVLAVSLAAGVAGAQTRPPAFLAEAPAEPRLETLHLEARAEGPARISADGRGTVTIAVVPKAKMHVYAADAAGYVPLTVKLAPPTAMTPGKVTYPAAETYVFPPTGDTSRVYMKPFKVTYTFELTPDARRKLAATGTLSGLAHLRYQACDERVCYRPTAGTVSFDMVR